MKYKLCKLGTKKKGLSSVDPLHSREWTCLRFSIGFGLTSSYAG